MNQVPWCQQLKDKRLEYGVSQNKLVVHMGISLLKEQGLDSVGMRPIRSAKGTMSVLAKRLGNGRSWIEKDL